MKGLGKGVRSFKEGMNEVTEVEEKQEKKDE
jgi:Sec-independent protein translocase protein TatA